MANEICSLKSRFDSKTTQEHFCPQRREHIQPETPRSITTQKTRQPTTPTSTTPCQGSSETKSSNNQRRSSISSAPDSSSPDLPTPSTKLSIPRIRAKTATHCLHQQLQTRLVPPILQQQTAKLLSQFLAMDTTADQQLMVQIESPLNGSHHVIFCPD